MPATIALARQLGEFEHRLRYARPSDSAYAPSCLGDEPDLEKAVLAAEHSAPAHQDNFTLNGNAPLPGDDVDDKPGVD